nr:Kinesin-associated domain containing protein [Haemonchus contortus]
MHSQTANGYFREIVGLYLCDFPDGMSYQMNGEAIDKVTIDAHPIEQSIVIKYQVENRKTRHATACQKLINLRDLNEDVDIHLLADVVMEKCALIPEGMRQELEQILFYLQNRNKRARSASSISSAEYGSGTTALSGFSVRADMSEIDSYIELFYEDTAEKNRGALNILELTKTTANLEVLIENETLIGALARVFREDWKKNFELATTIIRIFVQFSYYNQFQATLSHHKIGALCMNAMEYEIKRGELWAAEAKNEDEKTARKCRLAIRKQQTLLAACITLLTNLAHDINVELKMVRRDIVPMLLRCLSMRDSAELTINLRDLNEDVDIHLLADVVMEKCALIPEGMRQELEQILFYLQNRNKRARSASSISSAEYGSGTTALSGFSVRADMSEIDSYIELFYEDTAEKNRGALNILELTKTTANLEVLIENETLIGALARVFREDWKKNFELATTIIRIFVQFSYYNQFQATLSHHKIGALCMNAMEYEIKRGELWAAEAKNEDEKTARKCRLAIRKQQKLLAACITLLTNLAHDINVELKMVRRDIVPMLLRCLSMRDSAELTLATVQFLLKLSIFEENKTTMEQGNIIGKLLQLFPIDDIELRKAVIRLLFNLSFDAKSRRRMVSEGLLAHVAPLIESDAKALNLLYQLSVNDDAKAMLTFTDAMQLLMRDLLTGNGSEATKAVLLNACAEKRNAQLVCGHNGQGLSLLLDAAIDGRDLMVAKIVRSIAGHEGPTQDMFVSSMPRLLEAGMKNALLQEDENVALGLEFIGTAALIKVADWSSLSTSYDLVNWIGERLKASAGESEPLQLQLVVMCGTMARQVDAARTLVPLLEVFLQLLHTMQEDDEFVVQLLYLFLQLLRHRELANRLMGPDSALGAYVIDLMHDKNPAIREMCDNALVIIGEHSQEWARRIAGERFRWHNAQWLDTVEGGVVGDEGAVMDDDYVPGMLFEDQFDDGFDLSNDEPLY